MANVSREETKLMFCTYCEDQGKDGSFVSLVMSQQVWVGFLL